MSIFNRLFKEINGSYEIDENFFQGENDLDNRKRYLGGIREIIEADIKDPIKKEKLLFSIDEYIKTSIDDEYIKPSIDEYIKTSIVTQDCIR